MKYKIPITLFADKMTYDMAYHTKEIFFFLNRRKLSAAGF